MQAHRLRLTADTLAIVTVTAGITAARLTASAGEAVWGSVAA